MTPATSKNDTAPETTGGWRPEPGDVLEGPVVGVTRAWSDWTQSFYPIVTIKDNDTGREVDVHGFHETLGSRFMEMKPKIGQTVRVELVEQRKTRDGKRTVYIYRVNSPDETGAEVWDMLSDQRPAAARSARPDTPAQDNEQDEIPF